MADRAIDVKYARGLTAVVALDLCVRLVLMVVMTEMLSCGAGFVLAIAAHRCPTELQREQG